MIIKHLCSYHNKLQNVANLGVKISLNKLLAIVSVILAISFIANIVLSVMYFDTQHILASERIGSHASLVQMRTERDEALATIDKLNDTNKALLGEITALESERDSLKNQINSLVTERDNALADATILSSDVQQLRSGRLMTNLGSFDNRDNELQPFIHVYGVVWNVGTEPAENCRIHVVAKQGDVIAVDTYVELQTINGYDPYPYTSFKEIDEKIYYYGIPLTEKTVTIE